MKSLPSPSSGTRAAASAIDLDYPADLIECFLDFVSVANPKLPTLPLQQCRALLTFAELFDCPTLMPLVRIYLCEVVETPEDCANLLPMASDRDDWAMGRAALGRMDGSVIIWIRRNRGGFKIYFDRLRLQWRQRLMELLFLPALQENVHIACIAWSKVAPDFKAPIDDVGEATMEVTYQVKVVLTSQ